MSSGSESKLGWHVISGEALLRMLRRVGEGEAPDMVYMEEYANAEIDRIEGKATGALGSRLAEEFPLLWDAASQADRQERLGLAVSRNDEEAARAMHEIWLARSNTDA